MERYYFLFLLALIWCIFACVQDLRKREIANWLTFSLIIFALSYRAFYSAVEKDGERFFLFGLGGVAVFLLLAHLFYYSRAFAGGDAKLLIGFGAILPFERYGDFLILSMSFIFLLFFVGAIFSLFYSFFLVHGNLEKFKIAFTDHIRKYTKLLILLLFLCSALFIVVLINGFSISLWFLSSTLLFVFAVTFVYLKAVEASCLIVLLDARKLSEGDWLERDVRVKEKLIRKSVHGLSAEEISFLRKNRKKVWIKQGLPFAPAFLITLLIIGFGYLMSVDFVELMSLIGI